MIPETVAELAALGLLAYALYRALEPLRARLERLILRRLDPAKADIVDAEIVSRPRKDKE
ncbi:MAG: hypothetical protein HY079_03070 [Elusimicrobia bacterium]|nr:hypothetical protein [Elusimicrobiota bacterium]